MNLNIVTCGKCGVYLAHWLESDFIICPKCGMADEICHFTDAYIHKDQIDGAEIMDEVNVNTVFDELIFARSYTKEELKNKIDKLKRESGILSDEVLLLENLIN